MKRKLLMMLGLILIMSLNVSCSNGLASTGTFNEIGFEGFYTTVEDETVVEEVVEQTNIERYNEAIKTPNKEEVIAEDYTEKSYKEFEALSNEAKILVENENAIQEEVDDILKRLIESKEDLIEINDNSIYEVLAPEQVNQFDTAQFDLILGENIKKIRTTFFWTENDVEKSYIEYYTVLEKEKLTINRELKLDSEYRVEFTPVVNDIIKEEESRIINLNVIGKEEDTEIIKSVTGNDDLNATIIDKVGDSVIFKIETSLDIDTLKFTFITSGEHTDYYHKGINAKEIGDRLVWTIERSLIEDTDRHEVIISALEEDIIKDSTNYEVNVLPTKLQ